MSDHRTNYFSENASAAMGVIQVLEERIMALNAELAEARKDKERLDWLEKDAKLQNEGTAIEFRDGKFRFMYLSGPAGGDAVAGVFEANYTALRAAIDAAKEAEL